MLSEGERGKRLTTLENAEADVVIYTEKKSSALYGLISICTHNNPPITPYNYGSSPQSLKVLVSILL